MSRRNASIQSDATATARDAAGRAPTHRLFGEPPPPGREPRLPPMGAPVRLPLTDTARAAVMAGADPAAELARKFSPVTNARAGDVPADGTPRRQAEAAGTGSTLPVVAASRSIPDTGDLWSGLVEQGRILEPPYDPWLLVCAVDESDTLPQCVDVMARNIGGHGVELDPLFDTRDAVTGAELEPPPEAQAERAELQLWLAGVNVPGGLPGILDLADRDCETVGWGCVEVMRDSAGRVADLGHVPAYTVRLSPEDPPVLVDRTVRHPGTGELVTVRRWARFRRFCQLKEGRTVWFKAFGDPRHVNWLTGEVRQADAGPWGVDTLGNSLEATELVYVRIYHPATPYGVPRWIGAVPHVRASRNAAELIVDWFDNAPIGVKLAIIAGGRWKDGALDTLQDQIEQSTRGRRNAWNVVGLEGEAGSAGGRDPLDETRDAPARHSLEDLTTEIPAGLYLGRDSLIDRSSVRVRAMFRLGAIYFGDSEGESNRAAADTARAIGEEQVFRPLRAARWETLLNGQVLPGLGVNWWRLTLQGATTADDTEGIGRALGALVQGGGASPNSLAKLYSTLTGQAVELVAESWGDRPLALTLALLAAGLDPNKPLSELAAEVATKAQAAEEAAQAQAAAAAKVAAGAGAGGAPPADGEPPPDGGLARKALAVHELLDLRGALVDQLRAEGGDELAGALAGLPTSWTDHG